MKERQVRTIRKSRRLALKRRRKNRRSSVGEVFDLTPGKATNENDTLAERAAEQLGEAAAALHDQQSRRKARKGKRNRRDEEQRRKARTTKGKKGKAKHKEGNGAGRRARDSLWADPDETPRHSLVRLFDGSRSGGSTPLVPSSDEEPNTDDRAFIVDDVEGTATRYTSRQMKKTKS